ncbi:MAG: ribosomal protein S18-alanine N-acetyltransferase [Betaproteobacteria bacterium]|nr:ribosomal protein S18-alanine N-acetyltransferase [Betaproteobacteria bacterium]
MSQICPEITALEPSDLDALQDIEGRAYEVPWSRKNLEDSLIGDHIGIACRHDGRLVGYAFMMKVLDEMHLLNLTVDPAWQGRGWGRSLLDEVKARARARGCTQLLLEVRHSNRRALRLYRSNGFLQIGLRHQYYPGPRGREDAIVMRSAL